MSDTSNFPFGGGLANPMSLGGAKLNIKKPNGVTQVYDPAGQDENLDISGYAWLHGGQGNDSDPYKCNSRLYSPTNSSTTNFSVEQVIDVPDNTLDDPLDLLSLVSRCYDEGVKFVTIRYNDDIYWLTSYSPDPNFGGCLFEGFTQSISIGADGSYVIIPRDNCDQFVLTRANMTTDFTNAEYQDCVDAVTAGQAVCVQFVKTGATIQAQLTQITGSGTLVFEFTAENYHYRWEVGATNNAHTVELLGKIFGVPIFDTLQDAISSEYTLESGDVFETNGFHTSGDGGAARYKVSSTGTANGMDVIQLAAGKFATIQVTQECSPEQIGYAAGTDAVPYVSRLIAIGIKKIRLIKSYTWKTTLTLTTKAIDFVGNSPFTQSPATSLINVNLNAGLTSAIVLRAPNITFENLFFYNAKGTPSNETAVDCDWTSGANNYMIKFKRVRFVSFNYGVYFHGTLPWHITFEDIVLGWCNYGIVFAANSSILSFKNIHTNGCYVCGINMRGATQGVTFTQCNFGSYSNALHFEKYGQHMNQEYTFNGCNFELDKLDLDGSTKNVFIDVDNDINVSLDFSGCNFIITKQDMQTVPANMRFIRLGNGSTLRMTACIIEDDLSGGAYLKQLIDESRMPLQETGSLSIDSTTRFFEVNNALVPYVMRTGQAKGLVADGARTGSEVAISDCNTWIPDYDGQVKVGRVSTYESTQNMPVPSSFYGFLWTMGVIHNPNIRVWQMLLGSNGNIYTRLGMDLGSGMTWGAWKTITAS